MSDDESAGTESTDPFSPENVGKVQLIVLMRIYDVLMAMYNEDDKDAARKLYDLHSRGGILGSLPFFDPDQLVN